MTKRTKKSETKQALRSIEYTSDLRQKAMLVKFATKRWYGRGADEEVVEEVRTKHGALGSIGTFTKRFMTRDKLAPIDTVVNEARRYHKEKTLAWSDTGMRLLPAEMFFEYKRQMTGYQERFMERVREFLGNYERYVKEEKKRLNGLFKERDYPSPEEMEARFLMRVDVLPIPSAEDFRIDLGAGEVERIRQEIEERVSEAMKLAALDIWERMYSLVEKIRDRLQSSDGQVREALFGNLKELLVMLPKLNVTEDQHLAEMSERLTKELLCESAGTVRDDEQVRKEVAQKADKLLDAMQSFIGKV